MDGVRTFPIDALIDGYSGKVPEVLQVLVYNIKNPELGWRSRLNTGDFLKPVFKLLAIRQAYS